MKVVSVEQAESTMSELLTCIAAGEEIVIERDGTPVARLVQVPPIQREAGILRREPGWANFVYDQAVFAPMTDEEMAAEGWPV